MRYCAGDVGGERRVAQRAVKARNADDLDAFLAEFDADVETPATDSMAPFLASAREKLIELRTMLDHAGALEAEGLSE